MSAEMRQKVISQVPAAHPSHLLLRYAAVQEIDHKANFGKMQADLHVEFAALENGLVGSVGRSVLRSGKSQSSGRGMSLCGFIQLLGESSAKTDNSTTTALPVGKLFVPFGFKSSVDFSNRLRLISFEASIPSVCSPAR